MFRRYIRKLVSSLFAREVNETKTKETEIERQVNKLRQMQRMNKQRQRPRKEVVNK